MLVKTLWPFGSGKGYIALERWSGFGKPQNRKSSQYFEPIVHFFPDIVFPFEAERILCYSIQL
jgi:hypothetical protein